MELVYHKDPHGNFGDDLNELLWPEILSPKVLEADDLILVGIGSVLNEKRLKPFYGCGKRVVILGAGAGYCAVPRKIDRLYIKAVRGPLTAAAIGLPETAITDGAALLAVAPELRPERQELDEILFIPHHASLRPGRWDLASKAAGMQFGDPRSPVPKILNQIARAKLVVTEAMHGAILADTLRVPWIPVITSPIINAFKWRDWTMSLGLDYRPILLGASTRSERFRYERIARELKADGLRPPADIAPNATVDELVEDFHARCQVEDAGRLPPEPPSYPQVRAAAKWFLSLLDGPIIADAARELVAASKSRSFLSGNGLFQNRLERLQSAVASLDELV